MTPTREEWLQQAVARLRASHLPEATDVYVSVGWPGGRGKKDNVIGQCFYNSEGRNQLFISPVLGTAEEVLHVLLHEMIHAVCGPGVGHKGEFIALCQRVGLVKPWTATTPGDDLKAALADLAAELGEFPHERLKPLPKQTVQKTYMVKLVAEGDCGCTVRTTEKWLNDGPFVCPHGQDMARADA